MREVEELRDALERNEQEIISCIPQEVRDHVDHCVAIGIPSELIVSGMAVMVALVGSGEEKGAAVAIYLDYKNRECIERYGVVLETKSLIDRLRAEEKSDDMILDYFVERMTPAASDANVLEEATEIIRKFLLANPKPL